MAGFDTLEVDVRAELRRAHAAQLLEWTASLPCAYARAAPAALSCEQSSSRGCAITTYGRASRWVMDVTPMLALLGEGGPRTFRFNAGPASGAAATVHRDVSLRLSNQGRGRRPVSAERVYTGDASVRHHVRRVLRPHAFTRCGGHDAHRALSPFITGHGFGTEALNCAEFCNHEHHFDVNGTTFTKDHPTAGTSNGCVDTGRPPPSYRRCRTSTAPGRSAVRAGVPEGQSRPTAPTSRQSLRRNREHLAYTTTVGGTPFVPVYTTAGYRRSIRAERVATSNWQ